MKTIQLFLVTGVAVLSTVIFLSWNQPEKQSRIENANNAFPYSNQASTPVSTASLPDIVAMKQSISALESKVNQLNKEVIALGGVMQTQKSTLSTAENMPESQQRDKDHGTADNHAELDKYLQKQGEALETVFTQQTVDPHWSLKTKTLVHEALVSDHIPVNDIVELDCRNSMCRVELSYDSNNPVDIGELPMKVSHELPNMMVNQTKENNGSTTTVLYLSKNDFNLPAIDR